MWQLLVLGTAQAMASDFIFFDRSSYNLAFIAFKYNINGPANKDENMAKPLRPVVFNEFLGR